MKIDTQTLVLSLVSILAVVWQLNASATPQIPDQIYLDGELKHLHSTPLESYFKNRVLWNGQYRSRQLRAKRRRLGGRALRWSDNTNYRGYVATWQVRSDTLFLMSVRTKTKFGLGPLREISLEREFQCQDVIADWYSGNLLIPKGEAIGYEHAGFGGVYRSYDKIIVVNGIVVARHNAHNVDSSAMWHCRFEQNIIGYDEDFFAVEPSWQHFGSALFSHPMNLFRRRRVVCEEQSVIV